MSDVMLGKLVPQHRTRTGDVVFYRVTIFWIALMTTVIVLLLAKEFGWIG